MLSSDRRHRGLGFQLISWGSMLVCLGYLLAVLAARKDEKVQLATEAELTRVVDAHYETLTRAEETEKNLRRQIAELQRPDDAGQV